MHPGCLLFLTEWSLLYMLPSVFPNNSNETSDLIVTKSSVNISAFIFIKSSAVFGPDFTLTSWNPPPLLDLYNSTLVRFPPVSMDVLSAVVAGAAPSVLLNAAVPQVAATGTLHFHVTCSLSPMAFIVCANHSFWVWNSTHKSRQLRITTHLKFHLRDVTL